LRRQAACLDKSEVRQQKPRRPPRKWTFGGGSIRVACCQPVDGWRKKAARRPIVRPQASARRPSSLTVAATPAGRSGGKLRSPLIRHDKCSEGGAARDARPVLIDKYRRVTTKRFCSETCHYKRERLRYGRIRRGSGPRSRNRANTALVAEPPKRDSCRLSGNLVASPLFEWAPESPGSSAQSRSYLRDECARHSNSALGRRGPRRCPTTQGC
jgi:hypothetical protein